MNRPTQAMPLVFDLGGVLLDVDAARCFEAWGQESGVAPDLLRKRFVDQSAHLAFERGEISSADFFADLERQLAIGLSAAEWRSGWNAMLGDLRPNMLALVRNLATAHPIYLFSNTNDEHRRAWEPVCAPLSALLKACYLSHELGCRKPDREAFDRLLEQIGRPPSEILFLDDLEANVAGAQAAGLLSAVVRDHSEAVSALRRFGVLETVGSDPRFSV